jgi:hypothetical protein
MLDSGSADLETSSNVTLSCIARSIQDPTPLPYSSALTITVRVLYAAFHIIALLAAIILNALVIVLVAKFKKLHNHSFAVAFQVAAINLLRSLVLLVNQPNVMAGRWLFGEFMCAFTGVIQGTILVRVLLMFAFVIDRYLAVFYPYWYPKHKGKIIICLSIASSAIPLLSSIPFLPGLGDCYSFSLIVLTCIRTSNCSIKCSLASGIHVGVLLAFSTIVPFIMYAQLFHKGRKIQREEKRHVSETAAATNLQRRMRRSTLTFFILFIAVIAFVLPNSLLTVIIGVVTRLLGDELHPVLYVLTVCNFAVMSIAFIVDPIIIMRNPDMRETLTSLKKYLVQKWQNCRPQKEPINQRQSQKPLYPIVRSGGSHSAGDTSMARLVHVDTHDPPKEVIPLKASDHILPTEPPPLVEAPDSSVAGRDSPPETSSLPTETPQPVEASDSSVARQDSPPETSSSPTETPPQWKHLIHQWKDKIHVSRSPCSLSTEAPPLVEASTSERDSQPDTSILQTDELPVEDSDLSVEEQDS